MKRTDLTKKTLDKTLQKLQEDVEMKVMDLLSLSGSMPQTLNATTTAFLPLIQIFKYASADQAFACPPINQPEKYTPNDDITELLTTLFSPATSLLYNPDVPTEFWDTQLGYVCKVANARSSLDSYMPLTIIELATLADRKHTTVQQHCQRGSIKAVKDKKGWKIPPIAALHYLISIQSEPFYTCYNEEQYKSDLKHWLQTGLGSYLDKTVINSYYQDNLN